MNLDINQKLWRNFGALHAELIRESIVALHEMGFQSLYADLDTPCRQHRNRSLNEIYHAGYPARG